MYSRGEYSRVWIIIAYSTPTTISSYSSTSRRMHNSGYEGIRARTTLVIQDTQLFCSDVLVV